MIQANLQIADYADTCSIIQIFLLIMMIIIWLLAWVKSNALLASSKFALLVALDMSPWHPISKSLKTVAPYLLIVPFTWIDFLHIWLNYLDKSVYVMLVCGKDSEPMHFKQKSCLHGHF